MAEANTTGLSGLLNNKLFLQYLTAAGQDISAGNPFGANIAGVTNQNIATQNKYKLQSQYLKMLLGGNVPEGGKVSMDNQGINIKLPKSSLDNENQMSSGMSTGEPDTTNPFASSQPDVMASDLAGLTPQDVTQALQGAIGVAAFKDDRTNAIINNLYKMGMLQSQLDKGTRTADMKNFEYAKKLGFRGSFDEFVNSKSTSHIKDYEYAVSKGYTGKFDEWLREMTALGGGLNLSEFEQRKEITADVSAKKYFTDPKGLSADVDKYINSDEVQNKLIQFEDPKQLEMETVREKEQFIRNKIVSSGGKIVDARLDGRTFVFKVKWPNKTTSEVRYAN